MANATATRHLTVRIKRYDPERDDAPHWQEFQAEADPMDRVLDVLQNVKWLQDETLGLRRAGAHPASGAGPRGVDRVKSLVGKNLVKKLPGETHPNQAMPDRPG